MGFCTLEEHETFLRDVPVFEDMLVRSGVQVVKLWLDISRGEQVKRLEARRTDPLKALKVSPLDALAQEKWDAYSTARDEMLRRTHSEVSPWYVVHTDMKPLARIAILRHLLKVLAPPEIADKIPAPDPGVLYRFEPAAITDGRLEH
jgi:polyphosphate kinase 2 (PPK2 family)